MLKLIICEKTSERDIREEKCDIFKRIFDEKIQGERYSDFISAVFCGVKYVGLYNFKKHNTYSEIKEFFNFTSLMVNMLRVLTFSDIMKAFPIVKEYEGQKYECKDYFTTMEYLSGVDVNSIISVRIDDFLWNYYNKDIMNFEIKRLLAVDKLRYFNGENSMMEDFATMNGVDSYKINKEAGYVYNCRTHKTKPLKTSPYFLKLLEKK